MARQKATKRDAPGIKLHRKGNGPPLVLLHCLGVDHRLWDIAAAGLERDFTLLAYDFPGHGETPVPETAYGIAELSAQLAALLDTDDIMRAHVAGISLGGLVAQHFAATYPDRVDRLALIDTTPRYTAEMRQGWAARAAQARAAGVGSLSAGLVAIWFTAEFAAENPPAVAYVRDCFQAASGEGYALACEALAAADLRPLAAKITAPSLIICGEDDIPSFHDAAEWLAANVKNSHLVWLGPAKHASILEQPELFRRSLREFLA
jgi:3-oxoadipate enol-lactonase